MQKKKWINTFFLAAILLQPAILSGCASTEPVPSLKEQDLSFSTVQPLYVQASSVNIQTSYVPGQAGDDLSMQFAEPPDSAISRYAQNRFKPGGQGGVFNFIIEDASVYERTIEQDNSVMQWAGIGRRDEYEMKVRIRMYATLDSGLPGPGSTLNFRRTMSVPQSASLSERAAAQKAFLQALVNEMDPAITTIIRNQGIGG